MQRDFTKQEIEKFAGDIISNVERNFTNEQGLLVGNDTTRPLIVDDLGDFIPFLAYFGAEEMCKRHLDYLAEHHGQLHFREAFKYTDLLLGLLWYERIGEHKTLARELFARIEQDAKEAFLQDPPHSYRGYKRFPQFLKVFNTADSTFLEVFAEAYASTNDTQYLEAAERLLTKLRKNSFFKHHNVLPELLSFRLPQQALALLDTRSSSIRLMKNNTNFAFGLLELWRVTGSETARATFEKLADGFIDHACPDGGMRNFPLQKEVRADLLSSFATIDVMCDAHIALEDTRYLELARGVADFWLERQADTTGLFPKIEGERMTYLDTETDMIVALLRLWECTHEETYHEAAMRALRGLLQHHESEYGYILEVDVRTGKPLDFSYKTKYLALLLKPLIYLHANGGMYENANLLTLMKDR